MLSELVLALVQSDNEAADDVLVEALQLGNEAEQAVALDALMQRKTVRGLSGVIARFDALPERCQQAVLSGISAFGAALRECGRSDDRASRLSAMRLIALGRQGRFAYVLAESLHHQDAAISKGAVEGIVALARWVATQTRWLQRGPGADGQRPGSSGGAEAEPDAPQQDRAAVHKQLVSERPEIEQAVARAMEAHRGPHGPDLLRAALLLADWPQSKSLAILQTAKHAGQSAMVRRLQQPPDSEHVEAFLLGASHGGLRSHFGLVFARIDEAPVLDALLRKTHWLKNNHLQLCMHQVSRGAWWGDTELLRDLLRRDADDVGKIGEWLAVSGIHDVVQDERLERLREHAATSLSSRLRLLRIAMRRPRGSSTSLIKSFLSDPDERIVRLAAREMVRRRPPDFENALLQLMTSAPASVRRVVSRSVGQVGFDHFWQRFDDLDRPTRKAAGRAMLKILPDAVQRLGRKLVGGATSQQVKAVQVTQELGLVESLSGALQALCGHSNPRVRSKAIAALGEAAAIPSQVIIERVLNDTDPRVRANAIEVLEQRQQKQFVPMLVERARASNNRERANAIKALHSMKVATAAGQLMNMIQDNRADHRVSALWALKQIGWWKLLTQVGQMAKGDPNIRVRRYAMALLRDVAKIFAEKKAG